MTVMRSVRFLTAFILGLDIGNLANAGALDDATEIDVPKFALVIGNRDYNWFPPVPTALNDVAIIAKQLSLLHFDVVTATNVSADDLFKEVGELKKRVDQVTRPDVRPLVALYFSGHGFVASGRQFLAGITARHDQSADPIYMSTSIQNIVDQLSQTAILVSFIDACRSDLKLSDSVGKKMLVSVQSGVADGQKGLGYLRASARFETREYLIAYANGLGDPVAGFIKKGDFNSPYTNVLTRYLGNGRNLMDQLYLVHGEVQRTVVGHDPGEDVHMSGKVFFAFDDSTLAKMRLDWSKAINPPDEPQLRQFVSDYENGPLAYKASAWLRSASD
jgi:caspase domain-containing protein